MPRSPLSPKSTLAIAVALLLCGSATTALIATNAKAESAPQPRPVMVALAGAPHLHTAIPADEDAGAPPPRTARLQALCSDIPARAAGHLAFLETKLALSGTQKPLFERWQAVRMDRARRMAATCEARVKEGPSRRQAMRDRARPSPVDRLEREETHLKQRLADIGAERPALSALYASLSNTQKADFRPRGGFHRGMMMRRMHGPMDGGPSGAPPPPR